MSQQRSTWDSNSATIFGKSYVKVPFTQIPHSSLMVSVFLFFEKQGLSLLILASLEVLLLYMFI